MNDYDGGLSTPEIIKVGTRYEVIWGDIDAPDMKWTLDRVETSRGGDPNCEIQIEDFMNFGGAYLLSPMKWTLNRSPRSIITELGDVSERSKEEWKQRFLQVAKMVLEIERAGEPVLDLNDRTSPEQPPEMVTGLCYQGTPSLIFGDGGIGKSLIGLTIATGVHNGHGVENSFGVIQGNALILDYETSWEETYRRSRDIVNGLGNGSRMVYYRYCSAPLYQDVESLKNQIADLDIKFLLIDSAGPACGGEPENANSTLKFFNALRSLTDSEQPLTTLTLAHVTKVGSNGNPFGSVYWTNMPRNTFELKKAPNTDGNYMEIALHHRKTNVGKLLDPKAFRVTYEPSLISVENIDIKKSSLSRGESIPKQVINLYTGGAEPDIAAILEQNGGLTTKEIGEAIHYDKLDSLQTSLSRHDDFKSFTDENGQARWRYEGF